MNVAKTSALGANQLSLKVLFTTVEQKPVEPKLQGWEANFSKQKAGGGNLGFFQLSVIFSH